MCLNIYILCMHRKLNSEWWYGTVTLAITRSTDNSWFFFNCGFEHVSKNRRKRVRKKFDQFFEVWNSFVKEIFSLQINWNLKIHLELETWNVTTHIALYNVVCRLFPHWFDLKQLISLFIVSFHITPSRVRAECLTALMIFDVFCWFPNRRANKKQTNAPEID